jgi:hypothetical protein
LRRTSNARRAKQNHELDEEEAIIKKNLRVAMMLNGETPEEDLPRKRDGWLEFLTVINYRDTGKLTLGCIQRKPGGEFEFHS